MHSLGLLLPKSSDDPDTIDFLDKFSNFGIVDILGP